MEGRFRQREQTDRGKAKAKADDGGKVQAKGADGQREGSGGSKLMEGN